MPINVFGNSSSSYDKGNEIHTSLFVQKAYLKTNCIEANIEEDINLKNQFRTKNLPDPISLQEAVSNNYVDNGFNDSSIIKNIEHIDLNDRNITNARFIQVNQLAQIDSHLTAKLYVDNAISDTIYEPSLLRLDPDEKLKQDSINPISTLASPKTIIEVPTKKYVDKQFIDPSILKNTDHVDFNNKDLDNVRFTRVKSFPTLEEHLTPKIYVDQALSNFVDESLLRLDPDEKLKLDEQDSIVFNSSLTLAKTIKELRTKSYVDSLHESRRNRRDLSSVFIDQDIEFDNNKLTNLDSITVNRGPYLYNELSNKKYVDDSLGEGTLLRFNQSLKNYLKLSVGKSVYNLTKYNKIKITDTTEISFPNITSDLLQKWNIKFNNKINHSRITDFTKSTETNSPTGHSGATSLSPIGNSFMYIDTSSNIHGHERVFVSFEKTDIIQINNITLYYNIFSILNIDSKKSMGRFRTQLLLEDNTRSMRYNIPKNDSYGDSSTQGTLVNINFTVENYGIKLIYDQIDTPHADMCFSKITITHSVF